MTTHSFHRTNMPHYDIWRFEHTGYRIARRSSLRSADDTVIADDLTEQEMWAMVKLLEQPSTISVETMPYKQI